MEADNFTNFGINGKFFEKLAKTVLEREKKSNLELSVSFVGQKEIRKLNKKYRKKDRPTDVLSFTYKNGGLPAKLDKALLAGEIVICPQVVRENAKKFGTKFNKELAQVFIHGILHILGYNHEKDEKEAGIMENKTNYYLKLFAKQ